MKKTEEQKKRDVEIGQRIAAYRKVAGLSRRELFELSKVSESAIKQYESGLRHPRAEHLQRIASAFHISLEGLLTGDESIPLNPARATSRADRLNKHFRKLNDDGQDKAIERVEELTMIEKYLRKED